MPVRHPHSMYCVRRRGTLQVASYLQLDVEAESKGATFRELDARGIALVTYSVAPADVNQTSLVCSKQMRWLSSARLPETLTLSANVRAEVGSRRRGRILRTLRAEVHLTENQELVQRGDSGNELAIVTAADAHSDNDRTFDDDGLLPLEPSTFTWSLQPSKRRILRFWGLFKNHPDEPFEGEQELLASGYVHASIEHEVAPKSLHQLEHERAHKPSEPHDDCKKLPPDVTDCLWAKRGAPPGGRNRSIGKDACVRRLHHLIEVCPDVGWASYLQRQYDMRCTGVAVTKCTRLINVLSLASDHKGTDIMGVLTHVVESIDVQHAPLALYMGLADVRVPSESLLRALHTRTAAVIADIHAAQTAHTAWSTEMRAEMRSARRGGMVLAAGSALRASLDAEGAGVDPSVAPTALPALQKEISELLHNHLLWLLAHDAYSWEQLDNVTRGEAEAHWSRLHRSDRMHWMAHSDQLDRAGLGWAMKDRASSERLETKAKKVLADTYLFRHADYSHSDEKAHLRMIVNSIRAVANARVASHGDVVAKMLSHRTHVVVEAAAHAMRSFNSPRHERPLLALLRQQLRARLGDADHVPQITLHALETLLLQKWGAQPAVISEAVLYLLSLPRGHAGDATVGSCTEACRGECNPHSHKKKCHELCEVHCQHELKHRSLLIALLKQAMQPAEPPAENENWRRGGGAGGSPGVGAASHDQTHSIHAQLRRHAASAHHSWLGESDTARAWHRQDWPASESSDLPGASTPVSSHRELALGRWADADFETLSLTFIDTVIGHKPLVASREFGNRRMFGKLGGLYTKAEVNMRNNAWVRAGLFGGGFGIHLDTYAGCEVTLIAATMKFFEAALRFKYDSTYAVAIPHDLIDSAAGVADAVQTGVAAADLLKKAGLMDTLYTTIEVLALFKSELAEFNENLLGVGMAKAFTVQLPTMFGKEKVLLSSIVNVVEGAVEFLRGGAVRTVRAIGSGVREFIDGFMNAISSLPFDTIWERVKSATDATVATLASLIPTARFQEIADGLGDLGSDLLDSLERGGESVRDGIAWVWEKLREMVNYVQEALGRSSDKSESFSLALERNDYRAQIRSYGLPDWLESALLVMADWFRQLDALDATRAALLPHAGANSDTVNEAIEALIAGRPCAAAMELPTTTLTSGSTEGLASLRECLHGICVELHALRRELESSDEAVAAAAVTWLDTNSIIRAAAVLRTAGEPKLQSAALALVALHADAVTILDALLKHKLRWFLGWKFDGDAAYDLSLRTAFDQLLRGRWQAAVDSLHTHSASIRSWLVVRARHHHAVRTCSVRSSSRSRIGTAVPCASRFPSHSPSRSRTLSPSLSSAEGGRPCYTATRPSVIGRANSLGSDLV